MAVIPRSSVIEGAIDDTYRVSGSDRAEVLLHTTTLTAAQMRALAPGTPLDLFTPPSGAKALVYGVHTVKEAGAYGAGSAMTVNYKDTSSTLIATLPQAHFTAAGHDQRWGTRPALSGAPADQVVPSEGLDASITTAFTGNGGEVTIVVRYVLME